MSKFKHLLCLQTTLKELYDKGYENNFVDPFVFTSPIGRGYFNYLIHKYETDLKINTLINYYDSFDFIYSLIDSHYAFCRRALGGIPDSAGILC